MKLYSLLFIVAAFTFTSCSVDYDFDDYDALQSNPIVVNSILTPSDSIRVRLYKLHKSGDKHRFTGLRGAKVTLKENGVTLFDALAPDSILTIDHLPQTGATYTIEVAYDQLKTVKAQTTLPPQITCQSEFRHKEYWESWNYIFKLTSFSIPPTEKINLWITSYMLFENNDELQYNNLYVNDVLVDKTNSVAGMDIMNEAVGSIYYDGYIRVKNKNLTHLSELSFTPRFASTTNHERPDSKQTKIKVKLITASPEYDRFCKSLYEQKLMVTHEDDISSIFFHPSAVYSNVENGLGIFAGMNESNFTHDLPSEH